MSNNVFTLGGGAGVGSYVVVFKDGVMSPETDLRTLRGAYESGEQIYFSIIDDETKDALVPASGWIGEDGKLNLVARDFDDNKTYSVALDGDQSAEAEVKDGIEAGGEPLGGGSVEIAGNSLVIPEQPAPEPVFVDPDTGTQYFHKQEFDLPSMFNMDNFGFHDLLTGEIVNSSTNPALRIGNGAPTQFYASLRLVTRSGLPPEITYELYDPDSAISQTQFTSRAFTLVDTQEEVTDNTKICLPTCSAYYGFLSEDGKTFISYYNLKSDGAPSYIDSVKQGNASIPLHSKDTRLPDATAADVGKVLAVNAQGELVLQTPSAPSGGTKLYKHTIAPTPTSEGGSYTGAPSIFIISTRSEKYLNTTQIAQDNGVVSCYGAFGNLNMLVRINTKLNTNEGYFNVIAFSVDSQTQAVSVAVTEYYKSSQDDTVTEL